MTVFDCSQEIAYSVTVLTCFISPQKTT